jgi:hypothetical protein
MSRPVWIIVLTAVALSAGCVNVTVPERIEFNANGSSGRNPSQAPAADGEGDSWAEDLADTVGGITLGADEGVLLYGFDTLAYPGKAIDLTARLRSGRSLEGYGRATIGFFQGQKEVGRAVTDEDGLATVRWTPPDQPGTHEFKAHVLRWEGKDEDRDRILAVKPAPLLVGAYPKDKKLVVIDLDHTVVDSSFARVLLGGAKPMADSVRVSRRIAKHFGLVYLTHRPDLLIPKSKTWLDDHGYPPGPLLVSKLTQALGGSGEFKTAKLKSLREVYPKTAIGIGDKYSDAQAYVDNGMTAFLIPNYDRDPEDMRDAARQIRRLDGKGRLHVVDTWRQVEQGIFDDRSYPPDQYVSQLQRQARQLRREQEDDDDDDDDDDEEDDD